MKKWNKNTVIDEFSQLNLDKSFILINIDNVHKRKDKIQVQCKICYKIFDVTCDHFFSKTKPTRWSNHFSWS